jgi:hypothetical protein
MGVRAAGGPPAAGRGPGTASQVAVWYRSRGRRDAVAWAAAAALASGAAAALIILATQGGTGSVPAKQVAPPATRHAATASTASRTSHTG